MDNWIAFILLFFIGFLETAAPVRLVSVFVPSHVHRGSQIRLECHFDLEGESLYSVKWYKDSREFYRFLPEDNPPAQAFDIPGFSIELRNSSDTWVSLRELDFAGSGTFRCEISGEAPRFNTVSQSGQLVVAEIPRGGPTLEGGKSSYSLGELIRVNCTSAKSRPATQLAWFINGKQVEESNLVRYPIFKDENNFETSVLELEFKVSRHHFEPEGEMRLKCLSTLGALYWRTNEETFGNKLRSKSLISRDALSSRSNPSLTKSFHICFAFLTLLNSICIGFPNKI